MATPLAIVIQYTLDPSDSIKKNDFQKEEFHTLLSMVPDINPSHGV